VALKPSSVIPALVWLVLTAGPVFGESIDLNLYLQDVNQAAPPAVFGDFIILSCQTRTPARVVGARFSHEDFRSFHTYSRNENGVFVLAIPVPEQNVTIRYRIVIDGVWMSDPANPLRDTDERGIVFSLIPFVSTGTGAIVESPRLLADGMVEFNFKGHGGSSVTVAGDFNAYDPFTHRLAEVSPGFYRLRLKLLPGRHFYHFVVDGFVLLDPQNERMVHDADGRQYSLLLVR
jgi:hypothetical protein